MNSKLLSLAMVTAASAASLTFSQQLQAASIDPQKPNILVVVADDLGFADLGSFGGEIETPNLDALAQSGVRMTNFHTAPACSPTRAALLTGVDPHKAGLGNMAEEMAPNQEGKPGYEGYLNNRVVSLATLLKDAGYNTYLSGKWHLGRGEGKTPDARGFERSFSLLVGGASHWPDMRPAYAPTPEAKAPYTEDGVLLTRLPDTFKYSSQFYADKMIEYIAADKDNGAPFFGMLSLTAPHWPLQAPDAAIEKYKGRYDAGFDALFAERLQKQKEMGLVPSNAEGAPRPPKGRAWDSLSAEEQKVEKRAMEVYAAMVDEMDVHTGRVFDYLKQHGLYENTVVVFLSDNGAEGHDLDETWPADQFPKIRKTIDETNDFSYEQMGRPGSYTLYGPNWAWAGAPAFKLHKGFPTDGGTRSIAIIKAPGVQANAINDSLAAVEDVTPTLLELAGVKHPGDEYKGREVEPVSGLSLIPVLNGKAEAGERVLGGELFGKRFIRKGDWKLVHLSKPWGTDEWALYNLKDDVAERNDLSAANPQKLAELKQVWEAYAEQNNVILPSWVSGY
ncbi:arylsulfatase [Marinobacterium sediminicola]|uniref:Arylsulfatase n=1 Tax=Marinobacterium sediminicola TaxID=518898 RepID=A0ABY1RYR5_9GAMM|nr:arylsulfatase [Marinobacterium sediminicola]ULG68033.1 arylsulfatase [Marinobacterium sediminicola]SMR73457.1 arylsulfatase [Marinobacterium sediminicola]